MCLIISSDKASTILETVTEREIKNAATRNKEGVGVMYMRKGRVFVEKYTPPSGNAASAPGKDTPTVLTDFIMKHLKAADKNSAFAAHLRYTTHGENCDENTHPHPILLPEKGKRGPEVWMMHNGVISAHNSFDKNQEGDKATLSDTARFSRFIVKPILEHSPDLINEWAFQTMLSDYIGGNSKLCFLDNHGVLTYINDDAGTWRKGVWFSTMSYINDIAPPKKQDPYKNYHRNWHRNWQDDLPSATAPANLFDNKKNQSGGTNGGIGNGGKGKSFLSDGGKLVRLSDYQEESKKVKGLLGFVTPNVKDNLLTGKLRIKDEPNFKNQTLVKEIEQGIEFSIHALNNRMELSEFFKECTEDASELFYYLLTWNYDGKDLKDIWQQYDSRKYIAPLLDDFRTDTYKELVELVRNNPEGATDVYQFLTKHFTFPWQKNNTKPADTGGDDLLFPQGS